jgi:hypothetical protein
MLCAITSKTLLPAVLAAARRRTLELDPNFPGLRERLMKASQAP